MTSCPLPSTQTAQTILLQLQRSRKQAQETGDSVPTDTSVYRKIYRYKAQTKKKTTKIFYMFRNNQVKYSMEIYLKSLQIAVYWWGQSGQV